MALRVGRAPLWDGHGAWGRALSITGKLWQAEFTLGLDLWGVEELGSPALSDRAFLYSVVCLELARQLRVGQDANARGW